MLADMDYFFKYVTSTSINHKTFVLFFDAKCIPLFEVVQHLNAMYNALYNVCFANEVFKRCSNKRINDQIKLANDYRCCMLIIFIPF